jgi:sulfur carrier protein
MRVRINGQDRQFMELDSDSSLSRLVALLSMKPDRIAVERNGEIVPRSTWETTALEEGDKLEIVQFVGGGQR